MKVVIALIVLCVTLCYTRSALASTHELDVAGTRIRVEVEDGAFRGGAHPIVEWVTRSAQIVAHYYNRFPTSSLRLRVIAADGDGVRSGKTWGYNGGFIRIQVGREVTEEQLHNDWVLVHDAARPCLLAADRDRLLTQAGAHAVGGVLALPAIDTLKRADAQHSIEETVDRTALWRAQTPQMFRYGPLCEALDRAIAAKRFPTDEAQALEWTGAHPLLVEGSPANLKITHTADLLFAAALLGPRNTP